MKLYLRRRSIGDQQDAHKFTFPFSEEEDKTALFSMDAYKSPGPDGFSKRFYQQFW